MTFIQRDSETLRQQESSRIFSVAKRVHSSRIFFAQAIIAHIRAPAIDAPIATSSARGYLIGKEKEGATAPTHRK